MTISLTAITLCSPQKYTDVSEVCTSTDIKAIIDHIHALLIFKHFFSNFDGFVVVFVTRVSGVTHLTSIRGVPDLNLCVKYFRFKFSRLSSLE
jgi:hypothetical protein